MFQSAVSRVLPGLRAQAARSTLADVLVRNARADSSSHRGRIPGSSVATHNSWASGLIRKNSAAEAMVLPSSIRRPSRKSTFWSEWNVTVRSQPFCLCGCVNSSTLP